MDPKQIKSLYIKETETLVFLTDAEVLVLKPSGALVRHPLQPQQAQPEPPAPVEPYRITGLRRRFDEALRSTGGMGDSAIIKAAASTLLPQETQKIPPQNTEELIRRSERSRIRDRFLDLANDLPWQDHPDA
jgi:hypothetical protein